MGDDLPVVGGDWGEGGRPVKGSVQEVGGDVELEKPLFVLLASEPSQHRLCALPLVELCFIYDIYIYSSDVKLHDKGEIKHQV